MVKPSVNLVKILRVGLFPALPITINNDWERLICCHFANYSGIESALFSRRALESEGS
jgi:hypothetical protein